MSKIAIVGIAALLFISFGSIGKADERAHISNSSVAAEAFPNLTNIYVASGVRDDGSGPLAGIATVLHCTNWTDVNQQIRVVVRNFNGVVVAVHLVSIGPVRTHTASTHDTQSFVEDALIRPGFSVRQGSVQILATNPRVTCSAHIIDAAADAVIGLDLHLVRFNSWPGSVE